MKGTPGYKNQPLRTPSEKEVDGIAWVNWGQERVEGREKEGNGNIRDQNGQIVLMVGCLVQP